ncbi:MAG: c-type cytochrome [Bauldia sp.]|nr:c-type cytochrome [Bauldia sp.]
MRLPTAFALLPALALLWGCDKPPVARADAGRGDAEDGRTTVASLACGACHSIPGIRAADGTVGPSLAGLGNRNFIAGTLPNDPGTLAAFVRNAPSLVPGTAMPAMPLSEAQAIDVAAFLASLR